MHGGCVCMHSEFQRKKEVVSVINDMKVNWADITPSFSNTLAGRALCGHGPAHQLLQTVRWQRMHRTRVDRLLAGLGANDTSIVLMGSQEQSQFLSLPPSDTLTHEIGVKVAEMLALRNDDRLILLIGYDFLLPALGFDSIQAITLRMWLKKRLNANIQVSKLTSDTITISGLADLTNRPLESVLTVKLLQEIETMYSELHACFEHPTCRESSQLDWLVAGAIEINAHNDTEPNNFIYLSDIETVARSTINAAMVEPSQHRTAKAHIVKILDGITLVDFWQVVREAGYQLRAMPSEQWWIAMRGNVQKR
ncbi:MAG: hypothetical protein Q9199_003814, partial [Rusavskia elegans]